MQNIVEKNYHYSDLIYRKDKHENPPPFLLKEKEQLRNASPCVLISPINIILHHSFVFGPHLWRYSPSPCGSVPLYNHSQVPVL